MLKKWCLCGVILAFCGMLSAAADNFKAADERIQKWVEQGYFSGAGLWIVDRDGNTVHEQWWGGWNRALV